MKTIFLFVIIFFFFGCSFLHNQVSETRTDSEESYAVYSVILKDFSRHPVTSERASLLVINAETGIYESFAPIETLLGYRDVSLTANHKQALQDYRIKNLTPEKLTEALTVEQNYIFIGGKAFDTFFEDEESDKGWNTFYEKYPNSSGFITLSRVGFDEEKQNAFVYASIRCGYLCGRGDYILLTKKGKNWNVSSVLTAWAS